MNLFELQTRANVLVEKVNAYEQSLTRENINEDEVLAQQKFADIYCLRPVLKLLFGDNVTDKIDRVLNNDKSLPIYASSAPMWNTKFNLLDNSDITSDKHEFINNIDIMNNHNMIQLDATQKSLTYNNEVYSDEEIRTRQGINYLYSSNIQDAVASESQIANMFKWNTTSDLEMKDNTITTYSQVPGIVMYYIGQGGFDFSYSPTVSHSDKSTLNSVSFEMPTYNGSLYLTSLKNGTAYNTKLIQSQDIFDNNPSYGDKMRFNLRMFIPGTHYTQGRLESPQQIWIPDIEPPEYIQHGTVIYNKSKYNYQSHALYHELVFKGRRSGAKENGFDFIPTLESVADNDPQGLATRLALAKNKDYYINRPWFNELNTEYEFDSSKLADEIIKNSRYINSYYNLNTDYIKNTDTSTYNKDKAQISSNSSKTPTLTSKIKVGTDSDSTSPRTKYITGAFILDYDWSSIGTKTNIQLFEQYNIPFYCGYTSSGISFGWKGFTSGGTTKIDIQELLDPNNKLLITYAFYGVRLFAGLNIYNKTTNEYIFKGPVYHESNTNNYTMKYNFNCTGVIIDLKPRGITISDINGRAFNGDIGQMREFDSANSIDRLINLTDRIDIDRPMTDSEFYNTYKLDYNTYATAFELPQ